MNNSIRLVCAGVLLASAAFAAHTFEGKLNLRISEGSKTPSEMSYSIKGDKIRIDAPNQKEMGGMIIDLTKKEMMMLMTEQKMYMTMPVPDAAEDTAKKAEAAALEKTGETEKILGYTATKYIATDLKKGTSSDLWLAEGLGSFFAMNNENPMGRRGSSAGGRSWEKALAGKELFPLRVVEKNKAGKETSRMEVTAIDKKSLPDSVFAPPEGYQKFDMGGMMKGMVPGFGK